MLESIRNNASSWAVKGLFGLIIVVFMFWGIGSMNSGGQNVVAYVDDEPILLKDFERAYRNNVERLRQQNPNLSVEDLQSAGYKRQVLDLLINGHLMAREAERLGLSVTPLELRTEIGKIPAFQNPDQRFDPTLYQAVLQQNQLNPGEFEESMAMDMLVQKLQHYLTMAADVTDEEVRPYFDYAKEMLKVDYLLFKSEDYMEGLEVTDEEVQEFYERNKEQFMNPAFISFDYLLLTPQELASKVTVAEEEVAEYYENNKDEYISPEMVRARHILFKLEQNATTQEENTAKAKLTAVWTRINAGEDFAALAKQVSEGPSSVRGGDLDWFSRGRMVKTFEDAAFALSPGEVSEPVRTPFGWHLIKVEERREEENVPFEEVADDIRNRLAEEAALDILPDDLDMAVAQHLAGDELDRIAQDLSLNKYSAVKKSLQQIMAEFGMDTQNASLLFAAAPGSKVESPLALAQGYMLAAISEITPAAVKPVDEIRENIVNGIKQGKAVQITRESAEEVLTVFKAEEPDAAEIQKWEAKLKRSEAFDRSGVIEGLGMNPNLTEDAFAAEMDAWLPSVYAVQGGFVVARAKDRIEPSESDWEKERGFWLNNLRQSLKSDLFQSFLMDLRSRSEITLAMPEVFEN
jgi:peptidyl-prolyl cis-trans isomerase D